jgi:hypothetical protein
MNKVRFPWHPPKTRQYLLAVLCVVLSSGIWWFGRVTGRWEPLLFSVVILLMAIGFAFEEHTEIDMASGIVQRENALFGRFCVWRSRRRISDFTKVAFQRARGRKGSDTVFVGLLRCNGRFVAIRYFHVARGYRSSQADKTAESIASLTGLPREEQDV